MCSSPNRQRSTFFRSGQDSCDDSDVSGAVLTGMPPSPSPRKAIAPLAAVHASSTAPANYCNATAEVGIVGQPNCLWNGGAGGYNNPVLTAVIEAIAAGRIRVLAIGTRTKVFPVIWG